jgi:hypothetical protein
MAHRVEIAKNAEAACLSYTGRCICMAMQTTLLGWEREFGKLAAVLARRQA